MRDVIITRRTVDYAREFAVRAHENQMYGDDPYVKHLDDVDKLVREFGFIYEVIAYLHDTIEDTAASFEDIKVEFGTDVARQVDMISDPPGSSRKMRKNALHRRLGGAGEFYNPALLVKAADRLANVRSAKAWAPSLVNMYEREHAAFKRAVYRPHLCEQIWLELDSLVEVSVDA